MGFVRATQTGQVEDETAKAWRVFPDRSLGRPLVPEIRTVLSSNHLVNADGPPNAGQVGENPFATDTAETRMTSVGNDLYWTGFWGFSPDSLDPVPSGWFKVEIVHRLKTVSGPRYSGIGYRHGALDITAKTPPWLNPDPTKAKRFYGDNNDPWHANWGGGSFIGDESLWVPNLSSTGTTNLLLDTIRAGNLAIYAHGDSYTGMTVHQIGLWIEFYYPGDAGGWKVGGL